MPNQHTVKPSWETDVFALDANHKRLAVLNEGYRTHPYTDTVGKLTIGVGWNLSDNGLPEYVIDWLLHYALSNSRKELLSHYPWMLRLDPVRFAACQDLCFQMGFPVFNTFRRFRMHMEEDDYLTAGRDLMESKWFRQVGKRGPRMVKMIVTGEWPWPDAPAPRPTSNASGTNS